MNLIVLVCFFLATTLTIANPETILESSIDGAENFSAKTTTGGHRRNQVRTAAPVPSPTTPTSVPVRFPVPAGSCNICDTGKPANLTLRYTIPSKSSKIQSSYASCTKSNYPAKTTVIAEGLPAIPVKDGTIFTLKDIVIGNRGVFEITGWGSCHIDTSCYTPLVVGDQVGPFRIVAGNHCKRKKKN
jgi:hypothetical protein